MSMEERNLVAMRLAELTEILETFKTPGWRVIEKQFNAQIGHISDDLDEADNIEQIRRLQERKKAYKSLVELPVNFKNEYDEMSGRLETLDLEQQERDQYGLDS